MKSTLFPIALLSLIVFSLPCHAADMVDIDTFVEKACVRYKTEFSLDCTVGAWNAMLDTADVMGFIWNLYGFDPAYQVSRTSDGFHVVDPSGIEGDVRLLSSSETSRVYLAKGKLKNWGIPISLVGKVLFIIDVTPVGDNVSISFRAFGEGGDTIVVRMILAAVSPILEHLIHKRITRNVADFQTMVSDIRTQPHTLLTRLDPPMRPSFAVIAALSWPSSR